ncbi:uncharacterized protein FPRO_04764 [Fusarium proliferatum ET1]|uniref:Uncharacterized protein n=1 Tax=Fusarium proliferatum (strain ET1) TaxID=1227346 RepID=A0A1L7VGW8_FUSPR|nr:uncharacterized protein FPRO_04764 [Fusarium proliferatum ET1]CZR39867.1 uncharacterized protein FPRO_04764 [Fusarium proliferatum ET1]
MAQALNIEGIDSSVVLLVAGSGLAEPGVDILVQQRVCKLGQVGYQWELTSLRARQKRGSGVLDSFCSASYQLYCRQSESVSAAARACERSSRIGNPKCLSAMAQYS